MINFAEVRAALASGGLIPRDIEGGRLRRCPVEGDRKGKQSGAYRLFDDDRPTCAWWNWKTGESGVWVAGRDPLTPDERRSHSRRIEQAKREREAAQAAQWQRNRGYLSALWGGALPLTPGTPVAAYLLRRGIEGVPVTNALRYVPALDYWDGEEHRKYPAMLAAVTNPAGGLISIHRTYLTDEGNKAPVPTVKKLTRTAGPMAGASIKIAPPTVRPDGLMGLGVAEGIETALAASVLSGVPVWSCVSASGLAAFRPPSEVRSLYIFADNDDNGIGLEAAQELAAAAVRRGITVRVLVPSLKGDWADELLTLRVAG